jgi:hypothetical protein
MSTTPLALLRLSRGVAALALAVAGCSTDAVGIDACRTIESARCDAAPACEGTPDAFGVATETEVENCKTFYRDHCLVGLENTDGEPDTDDVESCVATIEKLAKCGRDGVETLADCDVAVASGLPDDVLPPATPCEALASPETLAACDFVAAEPDE